MNETTTHHARIVWHGDKSDLRAHTIQLADQTLAGSSAPDRGGDPTKADPEELFVAALSACHMLWLLYFARRAHLRIISYEDDPEGVMNDKCFLAVVLRPRVEFEIDVSRDVLDKLHSEAHAACFIANSVTCQVTIAPPEVAD
jgi:organic hydroperoxide reductase OsmC/OhrA